ncbi:RraA family protein [Ammoniphilus sp. 3BR4]|uniref:RraA family protein n=1 Tax=Ammoniphilus sp. 3BR4 TaxID=3158265 RepID=UPI003465CC8C
MSLESLIERLYNLDTCAVSDALDSLQMKGVVTGLQQVSVQKKICGRAVTVKLVAKGTQESKRHLGTAAIEAASNGDVIVVEHGRSDVAGWGGNLCIAAIQRGISGVIIDGACRDVDEMRSLDFPVYARAAVPTTARGRIVEHSFNEKIVVADVEVDPGDLVIADGSGIVFIPSSVAESVIEAAEQIVEQEALMAKAIREGHPVSSVMGKKYETMLDRN